MNQGSTLSRPCQGKGDADHAGDETGHHAPRAQRATHPDTRPGTNSARKRTGQPVASRAASLPRAARALVYGLALQFAIAPFAALAATAAKPGEAADNSSAAVPGLSAQSGDGAKSVGAVPAPSAARPFDAQAGAQPAVALVVPPLPPEQQKLLGMRPPTTANPGMLVPGGRRQTLTFADLGALDPLQLRGTEGQNGVPFSVRNDEVVTAATLHLIYSYSPALLPDLSQLKVLINGEVAATLPVPPSQAGTTVARDVPLDPRFITEFNHLNVELVGHYTRRCEDPANSTLWATVSNASSLDLSYASLPAKADLGTLPAPFFDRRDVRRLELPVVFAEKPDPATLEAAGTLTSWFGALAGYRGALFPAQVGSLPLAGNAVVFAQADAHLAGVTLPAVTGPTLAVVPRDGSARGSLLLVMGRNGDELKTAASALALGQSTLNGSLATISQLVTLKPRVPYDAPNWLPANRAVRFGELADPRALSVQGYNAGPISLTLRVPPDLFMWNTQGAPLDLRYHYSVRPKPDRSSLNVSVNGRFVQALQIPAVDPSRFSIARFLGRFGAQAGDTGSARRIVRIPPLMLTPHSQLDLAYYYDIPDTGECSGALLPNVAGTIDPDSTIDLSGFPHYMALPDLAAFANSGFPFTRLADLSETAAILPDDPTPGDYSLFLLTMGRMGESTGYPVTGVTVGGPGDVERLADKDLLVLGGPGRQPLLQRWAKQMPFSSDGDTTTFTLSDIGPRIADWWLGPHGVERAPARADLSLVSNGDSALIAGFESPLHAGRSVVALISSPGESEADITSALIDADVLPQVQGAMDVIHGRSVTVASNGSTYYLGTLPPFEYARWALSSHPLLLVFSGVLAAIVIAALFYRALRRIAARRLQD
ncbi:cellulose biosynthesis cyclic di-GMP-binding regulatory protein BcsB [Burkholderia plantarii]|uniref:cellulose biosynthesis cyclic di-GMP-binding regulatory protein BcsB n=1 Tax=Burkholderia plantarii TaxID=41899 RepID=UPI0027299445|nr:cellulose biosynthesis cyclic di-GMP-binding regulatory protein BcsB [Burkholderia plantarii]